MDAIDKLALLKELNDAYCELNHGPNTDNKDYKAVDYIAQLFKNKEGEEITITIPVCQECLDGMFDPEWTLLYCFDCAASQWVNRLKAQLHYKHNLILLKGCPECSKEFGGMYFPEDPEE